MHDHPIWRLTEALDTALQVHINAIGSISGNEGIQSRRDQDCYYIVLIKSTDLNAPLNEPTLREETISVVEIRKTSETWNEIQKKGNMPLNHAVENRRDVSS